MDPEAILRRIPSGSLRSYTWLALQMGSQEPQAAGQVIARETLRRYPTPADDESSMDGDAFPWWRVIGLHGDVRTVLEDPHWYIRQVSRLEAEGHILVPSASLAEGLQVSPLPASFE